jgi:hypothetical protein
MSAAATAAPKSLEPTDGAWMISLILETVYVLSYSFIEFWFGVLAFDPKAESVL